MSIHECLNSGLPFVLFREPHQQSVRFIFQKGEEIHPLTKIEDSSGFVFVPFKKNNLLPSLVLANDYEWTLDSFEELLPYQVNIDKLYIPEQNQISLDQQGFMNGVESIIQKIESSNLTKAILSRTKLKTIPEKFSPIQFFLKICRTYLNPYIYLFYHPKIGMWLGASPEKLLEWEDKKMQTIALAATQLYQGRSNKNWKSKEKKEFKIVADYILNLLIKYPTKNIEIRGPYTQKAGNLLHLKSEFSFYAKKQFSIHDFLQELHPTPAISGFPQSTAIDFLEKLEPHKREYFCGYLGYVSKQKKGALYVNLRCMKVLKKHLELYIGCGITQDSNPMDEWQESIDKQMTLLNLL